MLWLDLTDNQPTLLILLVDVRHSYFEGFNVLHSSPRRLFRIACVLTAG